MDGWMEGGTDRWREERRDRPWTHFIWCLRITLRKQSGPEGFQITREANAKLSKYDDLFQEQLILQVQLKWNLTEVCITKKKG